MFGHSAVAEQPFSVPAETTPNRFVYPVGIAANANVAPVSTTATSLTIPTGVQGVGLNTPLDPIGVQGQMLVGTVSIYAEANVPTNGQEIVASIGLVTITASATTGTIAGLSATASVDEAGPVVTANAEIYPTNILATVDIGEVTAEGVALVSVVGVTSVMLVRSVIPHGDANVPITFTPTAYALINGKVLVWSQIAPNPNTVYTPINP